MNNIKYHNDGEFNEGKIQYWLKQFCEWEGIEYKKELKYSPRFIEFILKCSKDFSTNKSGAGKFIRENERLYHSGEYNQNTADYLFKTFLHILREMEKKEFATNRKKSRGYYK